MLFARVRVLVAKLRVAGLRVNVRHYLIMVFA